MDRDPRDLLTSADVPAVVFARDGRQQFRVRLQRRLVVGRGARCDVRLPGMPDGLSREHLVLERVARRVTVTDLSRNGTWVDDERLGPLSAPLRPGAEVRLGGWTFALEIGGGQLYEVETAPPGDPPGRVADDGVTLVGASPLMRRLADSIAASARFDFPVHIRGETGSGKERVARALHHQSRRSGSRFVALNCGAIHDQTAESELFGHVRGAFTGANSDRPGVFKRADGGTVFLDEIAELTPRLQAALLRTLELREVLPLGASRPVPVDFRLVTATHRDLAADASEGRFREDLLYRVMVTSLHVPPLRDRPEDVAPLARHFLSTHAEGPPPSLSPSAVAALERYAWPGNVRQLRNAVLRGIVAAQGDVIEAPHLQLGRADLGSPTPTAPLSTLGPTRARNRALRDELLSALKRCRGNRTAAAALLGISRSTLYERMKRFGLVAEV